MRKKIIITLMIAFCMVLTLTSCSKQKVNKLNKNIAKSLDKVQQVETKVSMSEQDVIVYEYLRTINFTDKGADVTTKESTLNDQFVLEGNNVSVQVTDFNRSDLFKLNINKKLVKNAKESKNEVSFDVTKENLTEIFNNQPLAASSDAHFHFVFEDKNLKSMECTFTTISNRVVVITSTYSY